MKTKNTLSILMIAISMTAFSQTKFDLEKGNVKWTGKKITSQAHSGSLKFSSATLSLDNPDNPNGVFTVDMTSLTNDDLTGEWKQKLEGHLKSDDFFSVDKHPEATLVVKKVNSHSNNSYKLTGDLENRITGSFNLSDCLSSYREFMKILWLIYQFGATTDNSEKKKIKSTYLGLSEELEYPFFSENYLHNYFN